MSTWTHVSGCIRVDSFPFMPQPDFKKIFVKTFGMKKMMASVICQMDQKVV